MLERSSLESELYFSDSVALAEESRIFLNMAYNLVVQMLQVHTIHSSRVVRGNPLILDASELDS